MLHIHVLNAGLCFFFLFFFSGPFLSALLTKLESMMQNSLYVNLLLTGLISRLACYPKPLLRSFLLNHNLVFQPSVKSLMQVCILLQASVFTPKGLTNPDLRVGRTSALGALDPGSGGCWVFSKTSSHSNADSIHISEIFLNTE